MRGKPNIPGDKKSVEDLDLHEQMVISPESSGKLVITKVKTGWIYERKIKSEFKSSVFVPEKNE